MVEFLSPRQRKIYQELLRINRKAANAYKGALMVLRDSENPDRFSQAAQSLRELTNLISRKVSIPQERKEKEENLRKKLEKKFTGNPDLLPHPSEEKVRALIRHWYNLHNNFFLPLAHHGRDTSDEEFLSNLSEFEEILLQFLNPAPVALKELDSLLILPFPNSKDIEKLSELLKHPTYAEYFFSRLSSPDWLIPLKEHRFFNNPPSSIGEGDYVVFPPWPLSKYLIRISKDKPREVMDIIKNLQDTDNFRVHVDLIDCALQMPSAIAKEIVPMAKRWIDTPYSTLIPQKLGELIIKLSNDNEVKSALILLKALLDIKGVKTYAILDNIVFKEAQPYLDLYDYEEILSKVVPVVLKKAPYEVVEILCNKLYKAIKLEAANENSSYDFSYIWRPAIENHPQNTDRDVKNLLTTAIRDSLETIGKSNEELFKKCYELLSKYKYPIFKRLELHLMRIFPEALRSRIQEALSDKQIFSDIHLRYEYYHLLQEQFSKLPQDIKECILKWIDEGPDLRKFASWYESKDKRSPTQEEKNAYKLLWQMRYLSAIKDYVPTEWKEKWNTLVDKYGEPCHPDFVSYKAGWIGGSLSPLTREEIEKMSPQEIMDYLKTWKPSGRSIEPSREGLGTTLSKVVSETPRKYIEIIQKFKNLHPIYIYYLLDGFKRAIQKKNTFDLKSLTLICRDLLSSDITSASNDGEKYWWKMVKIAVVDFVEIGLKGTDISFPCELRNTIWEIIETFLQDSEPDLDYEREYGDDSMDPVTLSLNTVRGKAMHALIQYALWCVRCLNSSENEDKMTLEVKKWLEKMLNPSIEPTETIRSIYGLYLPTLFYLNKCWIEKHLLDIFPEESKYRNLWRAAWEAYITYSTFYCDIYKMLRTQYKTAINKLGSSKISKTAEEKLSEHLIIACLWGLEDIGNDSLIKLFFQKPQPEVWTHAIRFVGNVLEDLPKMKLSTEDEKKIINRIKRLWEWRIEEIRRLKEKEREEHVHELEWFGMWFIHGFFDKSWMISQLLNTLELTAGKIKFASDILDTLQDYVREHYLEVLKVLSLLTKAEDQEIFMITSEEKIKNLLGIIIKNHPCDEIKDKVNEIVDSLVRKGYHEFASFFISED